MHPIELDANLKLAKNQLRSGKVAEAEAMYRKVLGVNPLCADDRPGQKSSNVEVFAAYKTGKIGMSPFPGQACSHRCISLALVALVIFAAAITACVTYRRENASFEFVRNGQLYQIVFSIRSISIDNEPEQAMAATAKAQRERSLERFGGPLNDILSRMQAGHELPERFTADQIQYDILFQQFQAAQSKMVVPVVVPISYHIPLVPIWMILAAISISYFCRGAVVRWYRAKWVRCVNCGYDLRASEARCPECGTSIVSAAPFLFQCPHSILHSWLVVRIRTAAAFLVWGFVALVQPPRLEAVPLFLYVCAVILLFQGAAMLVSFCSSGLAAASDSSSLGNITYTATMFGLCFVAFFAKYRVSRSAPSKRLRANERDDTVDDTRSAVTGESKCTSSGLPGTGS